MQYTTLTWGAQRGVKKIYENRTRQNWQVIEELSEIRIVSH